MHNDDISMYCFRLDYNPETLYDLPTKSFKQDKCARFWFLKQDLGHIRYWLHTPRNVMTDKAKNSIMKVEMLIRTDSGPNWEELKT